MGIASSLVKKGIIYTYETDWIAYQDENGIFRDDVTEIAELYGVYVNKYLEDKYFELNGLGAVLTQKGMGVDA